MAVEIRVPQLGESVVEATIARWLKPEGSTVAPGDALVELETDKVNVEVPAEQGGVLQQIAHKEGETVRVGDVLALLADGGAASAAPPQPSAQAPAAPTVEVPSGKTPTPQPDYGGAEKGNGSPPELHPDLLITPVARKLAEDQNVDLRLIKGSGPHGRITKEDVAAFVERSAQSPATAKDLAREAAPVTQPVPAPSYGGAPSAAPPVTPPPSPPAPPAAASRQEGREERRRMSRRRLTIAARLVEAQHTAAMLTTFNEIDMTAVMDARKRRRDAFKERYGVNLGFMSFFTKAVVAALKAFPLLNAEIQGDEIVLKRYYDIGIAVSTDDGLVVPVLRDADRKTFAEIERDVTDMATRARDGKLTLAELQGGTFTITNGGVFGSLMSTPILNAPQVGILGMHKIEERPVVKDGQIVIRPMMYVALSYDHRIVDGSEAVRFLVRVKELIEDPVSLLVEG